MGQPFRTARRVEFHQTDAAGIMHFAEFFLWMEQAEHEMLRSSGLSVLEQSESEIISWPRVSTSCQFLSPVKFEDEVRIELTVARLSHRSVTYVTRFQLDQREVARGETTAVCCRVALGKLTAIPIPDRYRTALSSYLVPQPAIDD